MSRSRSCTSIVQGKQHSLIKARSVQVSGNGLPRPAVQLQLLWVRRVRVGLGQDVAIAVFVKRVLERVAVRRQALCCKQRVTGEQEKRRLKRVQLNGALTHIVRKNFYLRVLLAVPAAVPSCCCCCLRLAPRPLPVPGGGRPP